MSDDDLTSLRAEFNEILAEHAPPSRVNSKEGWAECGCGERFIVNFVDPEMGYYEDEWETHCAHVASVLASSPTVAALLDRVERAERGYDGATAAVAGALFQRDKARSELAALRAAVEGLADTLDKQAASADMDRQVPGAESDYWHGRRDGFMESAADARELLAGEAARVFEMGAGDDSDVEAGRCCPYCRNNLWKHNQAVYDAAWALYKRHHHDDIRRVLDKVADKIVGEMVCCDIYAEAGEHPEGRGRWMKENRKRYRNHNMCYWAGACEQLVKDWAKKYE